MVDGKWMVVAIPTRRYYYKCSAIGRFSIILPSPINPFHQKTVTFALTSIDIIDGHYGNISRKTASWKRLWVGLAFCYWHFINNNSNSLIFSTPFPLQWKYLILLLLLLWLLLFSIIIDNSNNIKGKLQMLKVVTTYAFSIPWIIKR